MLLILLGIIMYNAMVVVFANCLYHRYACLGVALKYSEEKKRRGRWMKQSGHLLINIEAG